MSLCCPSAIASSAVACESAWNVAQVMPLQWPAGGPLHIGPGTIQLGVAFERLGDAILHVLEILVQFVIDLTSLPCQ